MLIGVTGILVHTLCVILAISVGLFDQFGNDLGGLLYMLNGYVGWASLGIGVIAMVYVVAVGSFGQRVTAMAFLSLYALALTRFWW